MLLKSFLKIYSKLHSDYDDPNTNLKEIVDEFYESEELKNWILSGPASQVKYKDLKTIHFSNILRKIITANPQLDKKTSSATVLPINTHSQHTRISAINQEGSFIIMLDAGITTFLWMMNIAFLYGKESGMLGSNEIAVGTLLAYAFHLSPPPSSSKVRTPIRWPSTPMHHSQDSLKTLVGMTTLQEAFIISHELSHIELGHMLGTHSSYKIGRVSASLKDKFPCTQGTIDEICADRSALELCLKTLGSEDTDVIESAIKAIYLMFRYLVWLELSIKHFQDETYHWMIRHYEFQEYANAFYDKAGLIAYLTLEDLEQRLQPGAFKAVKIYHDIQSVCSHSNNSELKHSDEIYDNLKKLYQEYVRNNPGDSLSGHEDETLINLSKLFKIRNEFGLTDDELKEHTMTYIDLAIYRNLAKNNSQAYLPSLAGTLNNLALLHEQTNELGLAEKQFHEALSIYRDFAKSDPETYLPDVAMTLNNLALLNKKNNALIRAEDELTEALTIYRDCAKRNPQNYLPDVARILMNLGNLNVQKKDLTRAEDQYIETLKIRLAFAKNNPESYLPYVARTLSALALLYKTKHEYKQAKEIFTEALTINRDFAKSNPHNYLPYVAESLNNLASLHKETNQVEQAKEKFSEALTIYQECAKSKPKTYLPYVAESLNNLASLHKDRNEDEQAEKLYHEALKVESYVRITQQLIYFSESNIAQILGMHSGILI